MRLKRIIIDMLMVVILPFLMAYELIGSAFHEWVGSFMFILFIIHNIFNYKWYKALFKGKYTPYRVISTTVNILLFIIMLSLMISGIILSKHIFTFLPLHKASSPARILHITAAYWGYVLMSVHIGFHWNMALKAVLIPKPVFNILRAAVFIYGIYAFYSRQIGSYMFLKSQFVFFNFDEPMALFIADYVAVMILFAGIGYYTAKLAKKYNIKS